MRRLLRIATIFAAVLNPAWSQPIVNAVVNAASFTVPVEPGSIASVFGSNLAQSTTSFSGYPLPLTLAGTSVTVNGRPAPLYFVSPGQINFQVPFWQPYDLPALALTLVVTTGQSSATFLFPESDTAPGLFTANGSGCGPAAALNITPAGVVSFNSPSNSAQPGDSLALFGTGFGIPHADVPPDGAAAPGPATSQYRAGASLGSASQPAVTYSGLAPGTAGADQINLLIPTGSDEGCTVPLTATSYVLQTQTVSVSIHSGRGQCSDPQSTSYGQLLFLRTLSSGTANDGEADTFTALFPSGPHVQAPTPPKIANTYNSGILSASTGSCPAPGVTNLSAGSLSIGQPTGPAITAQPGPAGYVQTLPAGFIHSGTYTVSSGPSAAVSFSASLTIGSPIQIQTSLSPGTTLSARKGLTVNWTGGDAQDLVRMRLIVPAGDGAAQQYDEAWTTAAAGTLSISGICTNGTPLNPSICAWGIPMGGAAQVVIDVFPSNYFGIQASAPGLTQGLQIGWDYRYIFAALIAGN